MELILKLLKPENLKITLFLVGVALLGRSLATINPEYGISILTPDEQPQEMLFFFKIEVNKYIMTMLWPLIFVLINSIHKNIRVSNQFFYFVIILHMLSVLASFIWYMNFVPFGQETNPQLPADLDNMRVGALFIFSASLITSLFSLLWFKKRWYVYNTNTVNN